MINAKGFIERAYRNRTDITTDGINEIVLIQKSREVIEGILSNVSHATLLENEYNMCTSPYCKYTKNRYTVESVIAYLKKFDELSAEISEIESSLTDLRGWFCK